MAINIYVDGGDFSDPYFQFYSDNAGTISFGTTLNRANSYTFQRLESATSHPFYISDLGDNDNRLAPSTAISITGVGSFSAGITGNQNFTLSFNSGSNSIDNLHYFCTVTAHSMFKSGGFTLTGTAPASVVSANFTGAIYDSSTVWTDGTPPDGTVESGTVTTGHLNFTGANLTNAEFNGVTLNGANFTGANLHDTEFKGSTSLENVTFGTLGDVDGDGSLDLPVFSPDTTFTDVTFGGAKISETGLTPAVGLAIHESLGTSASDSSTHLANMGFTNNTVINKAINNAPVFTAPAQPVSITRNNNEIDFAKTGPYFEDTDGNPPSENFSVVANGNLPNFATLADNKLTFDYSSIANYGNTYNINLQTTPDSDPHRRVTSGTLSVAIGDPYIYPMCSSTPVKLPDVEACYRLYQSNNTFINAEVAVATKEHENRMMEFVEKLGEDTKDVIADGFFFSKFFIADGKNKMVVDLREKTFSLVEGSDKTFFNISQNNNNAGNKDWNGKATNVVVQWVTEQGNQMKATVSFFKNPHIENGISLSVSNLAQKALGLCVSNYRPKLMRVPSLITEKHGKIARQVKKSRNPFQKIAIQSNREKWIMKK